MVKRKRAGELAVQAASDPTKYNSLDVGYALTEDVQKEIEICIQKHLPIFDEPQFCVIMLIVKDPLIKGVMRRKFYAYPFLPKPRPGQLVMLYNKETHKLIRLWCLPDAITMAVISEMISVDKAWQRTKKWVDWFYEGWQLTALTADQFKYTNKNPNSFFQNIRKEHNIKLESENEYLNANREKLIKAGCKEVDSGFSEPFDFSKIRIDHIVDTNTARTD